MKMRMYGVGLVFILFYFGPQADSKEFKEQQRCADLVVLNIEDPDWNAELASTEVRVTFQNKGRGESDPMPAVLFDFDPTAKELKKLSLQRSFRLFLTSNIKEVTEDKFIADTLRLPVLQPKEKITMTFILKEHWAYDPFCELKATVNFDRSADECRYSNNSNHFISSK
ncbi:MAG: hypothetical protein AAF502_02120 [Bacteroidota bacterium]